MQEPLSTSTQYTPLVVAVMVCEVALVLHRCPRPGLPASSTSGWPAHKAVSGPRSTTGSGTSVTVASKVSEQPEGFVTVTL